MAIRRVSDLPELSSTYYDDFPTELSRIETLLDSLDRCLVEVSYYHKEDDDQNRKLYQSFCAKLKDIVSYVTTAVMNGNKFVTVNEQQDIAGIKDFVNGFKLSGQYASQLATTGNDISAALENALATATAVKEYFEQTIGELPSLSSLSSLDVDNIMYTNVDQEVSSTKTFSNGLCIGTVGVSGVADTSADIASPQTSYIATAQALKDYISGMSTNMSSDIALGTPNILVTAQAVKEYMNSLNLQNGVIDSGVAKIEANKGSAQLTGDISMFSNGPSMVLNIPGFSQNDNKQYLLRAFLVRHSLSSTYLLSCSPYTYNYGNNYVEAPAFGGRFAVGYLQNPTDNINDIVGWVSHDIHSYDQATCFPITSLSAYVWTVRNGGDGAGNTNDLYLYYEVLKFNKH